jgi:hypothetical protein
VLCDAAIHGRIRSRTRFDDSSSPNCSHANPSACHSIRALHRTGKTLNRGESEVKYDQWETANKNNNLRLRLDHGCVLFAKNALQQPHLRGSFIAGVSEVGKMVKNLILGSAAGLLAMSGHRQPIFP